MNKLKFFKVASISLLLLNVILVSAFLITKPKNDPRDRGRMHVKKHFKMDEEQHDKFLANVEIHHEEMEAIKAKQVEVLKPYLYTVGIENESEDQAAIMFMMKELEEKKIASIYKHLSAVKGLLNEDQLPLFDSFLKDRLEDMTRSIQQNGPIKHKK